MTKYFLDCGAHQGESIRLFQSQYPNSSEYKIISFEPNPQMKSKFEKHQDVEFHNVAIWIEDGESQLTTHDWTVGYSLFDTHPRHHVKQPKVTIKTIDFSKWIKENLQKDDYVILKMDIEGAEYKVLQKMFDEETIDYVNKLYIEFHDHWMKLEQNEHETIKSKLIEKGLTPLDWCAGPGRTNIPEKETLGRTK